MFSSKETKPIIKQSIDIITKAYDMDHQIDVCAEKLSELIVELFHSKRGRNDFHGVLTELADSYIMLAQMEVYFGITEEELNAEIEYKLKRQLKRMAQRYQIERVDYDEYDG